MSDTMLLGVLNMPPDLWTDSEVDKALRYSRYRQAVGRIHDLKSTLEKARLELESWNLQTGDKETIRLIQEISRVLDA